MESKQQLINKLKCLTKKGNIGKYDIEKEDYFEWEINDWRKTRNEIESPEFHLCGYKWDIKINKDNSKYINVTVKNKENNNNLQYNCSVSINECNDYSNCMVKEMINKIGGKYTRFDKDNNKSVFKTILKKDLVVITVYIHVYINSSGERKEKLLEKIKGNIEEDDRESYKMIGKDFYEWKIEDWKGIKFNKYEESPEIDLCGHKWNIQFYPNGIDDKDKDFISFKLINKSLSNSENLHYYAKCSIYMANYNYDSYHENNYKGRLTSENSSSCIFRKFLKNSDLHTKTGENNKTIVDNNKVIIGISIGLYKYNKNDLIVKELKSNMNLSAANLLYHLGSIIDQLCDDKVKKVGLKKFICEKHFEWKIDNWKNYKKSENVISSPSFKVNGHDWEILLFPKGSSKENRNYISLYLHDKKNEERQRYHSLVGFSLYIRNYDDYSHFKATYSEGPTVFGKLKNEIGNNTLMKITDLYIKNHITNTPLVNNEKLVIGAYLRVYEFKKDQFLDQLEEELKTNTLYTKYLQKKDYYEIEINDWSVLKKKEVFVTPEFSLCGHKWRLKMYPNGINKKFQGNISFSLYNLSSGNKNVYASPVFYMRNKNNYSCFNSEVYEYMGVFNKYKNYVNIFDFGDSNVECSNNDDTIVQNDTLVIGVYIGVYNHNDIDSFVGYMREMIDDDNLKNPVIAEEKFFETEIEDWKKESKEDYFIVTDLSMANYNWFVGLDPCPSKNYITLFLNNENFEDGDEDKKNSQVYVKFVFYVRNYKSFRNIGATSSKDKVMEYNKDKFGYSSTEFIKKSALIKEPDPLIEDNRLVFGAYVRIYKEKPKEKIRNKEFELQLNQKNGISGIRYKYDDKGDLGIELYECKINPINKKLEMVNYEVKEDSANGQLKQSIMGAEIGPKKVINNNRRNNDRNKITFNSGSNNNNNTNNTNNANSANNAITSTQPAPPVVVQHAPPVVVQPALPVVVQPAPPVVVQPAPPTIVQPAPPAVVSQPVIQPYHPVNVQPSPQILPRPYYPVSSPSPTPYQPYPVSSPLQAPYQPYPVPPPNSPAYLPQPVSGPPGTPQPISPQPQPQPQPQTSYPLPGSLSPLPQAPQPYGQPSLPLSSTTQAVPSSSLPSYRQGSLPMPTPKSSLSPPQPYPQASLPVPTPQPYSQPPYSPTYAQSPYRQPSLSPYSPPPSPQPQPFSPSSQPFNPYSPPAYPYGSQYPPPPPEQKFSTPNQPSSVPPPPSPFILPSSATAPSAPPDQ